MIFVGRLAVTRIFNSITGVVVSTVCCKLFSSYTLKARFVLRNAVNPCHQRIG